MLLAPYCLTHIFIFFYWHEFIFPGSSSLGILCILNWENFLPEKIYFDSWKLGHATNMAPFSLKFLLGHFHPERLGTRNSRKAGLWPSVLREDSLVPLPRAHNEKSMFLAGTLPLEIWSPPPPPPLPFSVSLRAQSVWSLALDSVLWFNFPHCPGPKLGLLFPEGTATKIKPL